MNLSWVDYSIIGVIALSAIISLVRGFVREVLSLATWVLAFWLAFAFFRDFAVVLERWISVPSVRLGVAFGGLLLVCLLIGGIIGYLAGQLVDKTGLSGTDRLLGSFFGVARGVILVSTLVLLAGLTPFPKDHWWQQSVLIPYFQEVALWLKGLLPPDIAAKFTYS